MQRVIDQFQSMFPKLKMVKVANMYYNMSKNEVRIKTSEILDRIVTVNQYVQVALVTWRTTQFVIGIYQDYISTNKVIDKSKV